MKSPICSTIPLVCSKGCACACAYTVYMKTVPSENRTLNKYTLFLFNMCFVLHDNNIIMFPYTQMDGFSMKDRPRAYFKTPVCIPYSIVSASTNKFSPVFFIQPKTKSLFYSLPFSDSLSLSIILLSMYSRIIFVCICRPTPYIPYIA